MAWPGLQAALADQRRLLVAGDARDRDAVGQVVEAAGDAEIARAGADLGQYSRRNLEDLTEVVGQLPGFEVHQQGPRGVGDVGEMLAGRRSGARSSSVSTVPAASSPPSARGRAPGT